MILLKLKQLCLWIFLLSVHELVTAQTFRGATLKQQKDPQDHHRPQQTHVSNAKDTSVAVSAFGFGSSLRHSQFRLNYTNFNHGSFGACPNYVLDYQTKLQLQQEQQPDIWFRSRHYQLQNETRDKIADYVGAPVDGMLLVESASTAVNAIMRSFPWNDGDIILMFSVAYPMVHNTADWLARRYNLQIEIMPITFPIDGPGVFIEALHQVLSKIALENSQERLRMIVFDHMVSIPAIQEPIANLAAIVKGFQSNCFVLVDGAHTMGQVALDLKAIGNMDAYLSNGHKWLYSPKGSAFLWINTTSGFVSDTFPEPTVISSANPIGATSLVQRFAYISSRDYTAFVSMDAALEFRQILGGEATIYEYCRTLALQAKHFLMQLWNVTALAPDEMEDFMINLPLPIQKEQGTKLQEFLLHDHGIYMIVACEPSSEIVYTRLSAQVYLEFWDFERLGHLVWDFANNNNGNNISET